MTVSRRTLEGDVPLGIVGLAVVVADAAASAHVAEARQPLAHLRVFARRAPKCLRSARNASQTADRISVTAARVAAATRFVASRGSACAGRRARGSGRSTYFEPVAHHSVNAGPSRG